MEKLAPLYVLLRIMYGGGINTYFKLWEEWNMLTLRTMLSRLLTYEASLIRNYETYSLSIPNEEVKKALLELAEEHKQSHRRLKMLYKTHCKG